MTRSLAIGLLLGFASALFAQANNQEKAATPAGEEPKKEAPKDVGVKTETIVTQETAAEQTLPPPAPNYSGDIWHRNTLTGDWGGFRNDLAAKGITLDVATHNYLQGNAHGGYDTDDGIKYSGTGHYTLTLDSTRMGLWPGATLLLHAENKWGNGINRQVGALLPVNFDAYKPSPDDSCVMTLSEWILFQALFEGKVVLIGGKLDGSRAFDRNVFANDERTQFMNLGLRNNPMIGAFLPYTNIGAGFILNPTKWLSIVTAVTDAEGKATTTGFETAFHGPTHTSLIHEYDVKVKPFGLDGNQRVGFIWSSKEFQNLQPIEPFASTGPLVMKLLGPRLFGKVAKYLPFDSAPDNVAVYYNFDQYLYQEAQDRTQGIGLFGRFGWARQDVNPIAHFYSIGVGGRGVLPERDKDTCGVGYYYSDLSNNLRPFVFDEQGIECYYNIEITPWLHISPDLQIIMDPGGNDSYDTSLVYGFRMAVDL